MNLVTQVERYFNGAERTFSLTYEQIKALNFDLGFQETRTDGVVRHVTTHEVSVSAQRIQDGCLTNVIFSGAHPILIEFLDEEVTPHLSDFIELRYVLEGCLVMDFEKGPAVFGSGEMCLIGSSSLHRETLEESQCTYLNIALDRHAIDESLLLEVGASSLQRFLRSIVLSRGGSQEYLRFTPQDDKNRTLLEQEIAFVFGESRRRYPGHADIVRGHIVRLMDLLARSFVTELTPNEEDAYNAHLFQAVSDFMVDNLATVTMRMLADEFHYHPNFFNRLIRRNVGMTYSTYLIGLRIERAKTVLSDSDLPVDKVARMVGYNNRTFFYQKFGETCGMSPAAWRRAHAQSSR